MLRSPAFTLAAVSTLALAIGANTSIFAVVERVVLNPLPYPDSDRLIRSFQKLRAVDPGVDATSALSFSIGLPMREYPTRRAAVAAHHAILDRLSAIPGVTAASASTCLPLAGGCFGNGLIVEGQTPEPGMVRPFVFFRGIAGGYLEAMRIRVLRGRGIDRGDIERREPNIVANKAFADAYFPNADPIGRRVKSSTPPGSSFPAPDWLTIVGRLEYPQNRARRTDSGGPVVHADVDCRRA